MLFKTTLETELRKLIDPDYEGFSGWPATREAAISNWTNAYDAYAISANDASGDSLLSANKALFEAALLSGMPSDPITGDVTTAATAFESAFTAYWLNATFNITALIPGVAAGTCANVGGTMLFSSELTSIVTSVIPNILKPALIAELAIPSNDGAAKAASLADILHTATTTAVVVTISGLDTTPPPSGPLPITNICTIT